MDRHFNVTVYVMNSNREFLFIHHKKLGKWLPPGGHIENNEEPDVAACRETKEETGLDIQLLGEHFPRESDYVRPFGIQKNVIVEGSHIHMDMIYCATVIGNNSLVLNAAETTGIMWCNINEICAPNFDTFPETQKWCERFYQMMS